MAKKTTLRRTLRKKQKGKCCYCGVLMTPATNPKAAIATTETVEHLRRRSDGGTDRKDNLALACYDCNTNRGGMDWLTYTSYRRGELWSAV